MKNRRIWYTTQKPYANATEEEQLDEVVTELDIVYGDSEPFWGFERVDGLIYPGREGKSLPISLLARKGFTRTSPSHLLSISA